jgi:hypothetical protein
MFIYSITMNNKINPNEIEKAKFYNYNNVTNFMDNDIGEFCPINYTNSQNNNDCINCDIDKNSCKPLSNINKNGYQSRSNIDNNSYQPRFNNIDNNSYQPRFNIDNNSYQPRFNIDNNDIRRNINTRLSDDFNELPSFDKYHLNNIQSNDVSVTDIKKIDEESKDYLNHHINDRFNQSSNLSQFNRFNRDNLQCSNGICRPVPSKNINNSQKQYDRINNNQYNNNYKYDIQGRIKKN